MGGAAARRLKWTIGGATLALVLAGGAVELVGHGAGAIATRADRRVRSDRPARRAGAGSSAKDRPAPAPPLEVVGVSPARGETGVSPLATLSVRFSAPIAATSVMPGLTPDLAGSWSGAGSSTLVFHPAQRLIPDERVRVVVPAGAGGVSGARGQHLGRPFSFDFAVAGVPVLRLQQLLAELGYLPVAFDPAGTAPATSPAAGLATEARSPSSVSLEPRPGRFVWRFSNIPAQLAAQWSPGVWNTATQGAVMAFESDHGLGVDGIAGPLVWAALLEAVARRDATTRPYDYLLVTETEPETLYVWRDGAVVYSSLANTGVQGAQTPLGTWPVYLRYLSTTMSGTNPDGTTYDDPGVPYVAYFNGSDAVHGFVRSSYGFPQSDGCVELPVANAAVVFPEDPYGTLVTVTTGDLAAELGVATPPAGGPAATPPGPPRAPTSAAGTTTRRLAAPSRAKTTGDPASRPGPGSLAPVNP